MDEPKFDNEEARSEFIKCCAAVTFIWDNFNHQLLSNCVGIRIHSSLYGVEQRAVETLRRFIESCGNMHEPIIKAVIAKFVHNKEMEMASFDASLSAISSALAEDNGLPEHCVAKAMLNDMRHVLVQNVEPLVLSYSAVATQLKTGFAEAPEKGNAEIEEFGNQVRGFWEATSKDANHMLEEPMCPKQKKLAKVIEDSFMKWRDEGLNDDEAYTNATADGARVKDRIIDAECELDCPNQH